jgi:hypothetical protein
MPTDLEGNRLIIFSGAGFHWIGVSSETTHWGLDKDAPETRQVQPPEEGNIVAFPEVGGLHHRYERQAA